MASRGPAFASHCVGCSYSLPLFDRLTSLRSDIAQEVKAFLAESAAALDATPWIWPHTGKPILASDVFVDLDVLTRRSERESLAPQSVGRQVVETDAARYELPSTVDQANRLRWSQLMRGSDRRVLKGAPGSGKSFLSRHAAAVRLRQAHADLHSRRTRLADLPATLWVSARAIADADSKTIAEALVSAAVAGSRAWRPLAPAFARGSKPGFSTRRRASWWMVSTKSARRSTRGSGAGFARSQNCQAS